MVWLIDNFPFIPISYLSVVWRFLGENQYLRTNHVAPSHDLEFSQLSTNFNLCNPLRTYIQSDHSSIAKDTGRLLKWQISFFHNPRLWSSLTAVPRPFFSISMWYRVRKFAVANVNEIFMSLILLCSLWDELLPFHFLELPLSPSEPVFCRTRCALPWALLPRKRSFFATLLRNLRVKLWLPKYCITFMSLLTLPQQLSLGSCYGPEVDDGSWYHQSLFWKRIDGRWDRSCSRWQWYPH